MPESNTPAPASATAFVVVCDLGYDGQSVYAVFLNEQEARSYAYDQQQGAYPGATFFVQGYQGDNTVGKRWEAPKAPKAPKLPREYTEAMDRYKRDMAQFEQDRREFEGR